MADPIQGTDEKPGEDRQRRPHERGGDQQQHPRKNKPDQAEEVKGGVGVLVDQPVERLHRLDEPGKHEAVQGDRSFQEGEDAERVCPAVDEPAGQKTPQGQPAHEGTEHRRDGIGGVPHHQAQQPRPDDLVDQARRAGDEKGAQHDRPGPAEGNGGFPGLSKRGMQGERARFYLLNVIAFIVLPSKLTASPDVIVNRSDSTSTVPLSRSPFLSSTTARCGRVASNSIEAICARFELEGSVGGAQGKGLRLNLPAQAVAVAQDDTVGCHRRCVRLGFGGAGWPLGGVGCAGMGANWIRATLV